MGNIFGRLKWLFTAFFAERAHATSILHRAVAKNFRLPCSADVPAATQNNQGCPIRDYLDTCNELLFHVGLELREQRGGSLSLVSFDASSARVAPPADVDLYRTKTFLRWLIRTHVCITSLVLRDKWVTAPGDAIVEELPDNNHIKKLLVRFPSADAPHSHIATLLPRLRFLEDLSLYHSPNTSAFVEAVSGLLRTTTCLRSLTLQACYSGQPPKTLADALAANSTLKMFELWTNWHATVPPGALGNYVMSDQMLTKLVLTGDKDDRQELLLVECLARNSTVSTLYIHSVCGGESTARFLTRILAECPGLKKLALRKVQDMGTNISDATLTLSGEALAANKTLQELTFPYSLWHPKNWIAFFNFLPRNTHLRSLKISHYNQMIHVRNADIRELLACASSSPRVFFNIVLRGDILGHMHFKAFSRLRLSESASAKLRVLEQLPTLDHFTLLWVHVPQAGEPFFSSLANYIRSTAVLQRLILTVTNSSLATDMDPSLHWTRLSDSLSANTSIARFEIHSQGNFQYSDQLARSVGRSRSITRVTLRLNPPGDADEFLCHLSAALGENYNLLEMNSVGVIVGVEAKHWLFRIRETMRRNCGLLDRAAAYHDTGHLNRYAFFFSFIDLVESKMLFYHLSRPGIECR
ncbi:hypothetical protein HPB51_000327 [Rhipicephalus microplus]|uniref:Uncharacterized protein n=1 Tax=Rhipicephalus microplus TaxID=6941 RepID=A0A9J6EQS2_RHIMP|nr:hypothetical protein HPB51_000327 [Rhipicephalus microplus]